MTNDFIEITVTNPCQYTDGEYEISEGVMLARSEFGRKLYWTMDRLGYCFIVQDGDEYEIVDAPGYFIHGPPQAARMGPRRYRRSDGYRNP